MEWRVTSALPLTALNSSAGADARDVEGPAGDQELRALSRDQVVADDGDVAASVDEETKDLEGVAPVVVVELVGPDAVHHHGSLGRHQEVLGEGALPLPAVRRHRERRVIGGRGEPAGGIGLQAQEALDVVRRARFDSRGSPELTGGRRSRMRPQRGEEFYL